MLGICYGMQAMVQTLGGKVEGAESGEFGRTELTLTDDGGRLLAGLPEDQSCWMSHRDVVLEPPEGFAALASTPGSPVAACEAPDRGLYGIQFHPEVVHTPYGTEILTRFLREIAGCEEQWSPQSVIAEQVASIRAQVGEGRVICGLSGGVDSSVAALLVHRAVGEQLTCVFVDHGLMRLNEAEQVVEAFERLRDPAGPRRRRGAVPGAAGRRRRPRDEAEDHRRGVHPGLRGGGGEARGRPLPGPGHPLLGRDRVRRQRPRGDDQVPPQRRRPPGRPRVRAGRAAADAVQGRGAGGRRRARALRTAGLAPALPRPRPRDPDRRRRGDEGKARHPPRRRRRSSRRRSAPPSSIASSGSRSASSRSSARSASRATGAPTPTRS